MARFTFRISGKTLTEKSRDFVLEDAWSKGVRFLLDGLEGMTYDYAIQILTGKQKLVGEDGIDEGIELADEKKEDVAEYLEEVSYLYGGLYNKCGDDWYRPYAVVTDFGPEDLFIRDEPVYKIRRALHYADDSNNDIAIVLWYDKKGVGSREGTVLFKKTMVPPFWRDTIKNPQKALNDYVKTHDLPEKGYIERYRPVENARIATAFKMPQYIDKKEDEEKKNIRIQKEVDTLKSKIIAKAEKEGGFFELIVTYPSNKIETYKVSFLPFKAWSIGDYKMWKTVSPAEFKMANDDQLHTDWVVGAGISIHKIYGYERDRVLCDAIWDKRFAFEQEKKLAFIPLKGTGRFTGIVSHPKPNEESTGNEIIVIPNLSTDYYISAQKALVVIAEQGGEMSHLVKVSDTFNIVRIHDALKLFKPGQKITVDFDKKFVVHSLKC